MSEERDDANRANRDNAIQKSPMRAAPLSPALIALITIVVIITLLIVIAVIVYRKKIFAKFHQPRVRFMPTNTSNIQPTERAVLHKSSPIKPTEFLFGRVDGITKDKISISLFDENLVAHHAELYKNGKFTLGGKTKYYRRTIGYDKEILFLQHVKYKEEALRFFITVKLLQNYLEARKLTMSELSDVIVYCYTLFKDLHDAITDTEFDVKGYLSALSSTYLTKVELLLDGLDNMDADETDEGKRACLCREIYNNEYGIFSSLVLNYEDRRAAGGEAMKEGSDEGGSDEGGSNKSEPIITNNLDMVEMKCGTMECGTMECGAMKCGAMKCGTMKNDVEHALEMVL